MSKLPKMTPSQLAEEFEADADERFHESFWVEVANYLRHLVVAELPEAKQRRIVGRLREVALRFPGRSGGGDVRTIIYWLCEDRYSTCDEAARAILEAPGVDHLVSRLRLPLASLAGTEDQHTGTSERLGLSRLLEQLEIAAEEDEDAAPRNLYRGSD